MKYFNSHARVGRDAPSGLVYSKLANFNSHARVGRDGGAITTPGYVGDISTHTPAWGVTLLLRCSSRSTGNFNSHARVGRDQLGQ